MDNAGATKGLQNAEAAGTVKGQQITATAGTVKGQQITGTTGAVKGQQITGTTGAVKGQQITATAGMVKGQQITGTAGTVKRPQNADTPGTTGARKMSTDIRTMAQIAMLGAVSVILMLIEFPLPFLAPPFYQLDFSEVPVLIGTFAMGPLAGAVIEFIKILLNLIINGTITAGVGELANFIIGCSMILPAGVIYRKNKTKKHAVMGMAVGTVIMTVMGCFINAFVLLPAYSAGLGIPMDALVGMGTAINPAITNVTWFVVLAVAPFNLLKGIVVSIVTMLLYKRVSVIIKGSH